MFFKCLIALHMNFRMDTDTAGPIIASVISSCVESYNVFSPLSVLDHFLSWSFLNPQLLF